MTSRKWFERSSFIPEMDMGLAELEILHIQFFHRADPKEVQRREEPASATALLVGHRPFI